MITITLFFACFLFADPNRLKPVIAAWVQQKTGYTVRWDGKIAWSFYPHFRIHIDRATLFLPSKSLQSFPSSSLDSATFSSTPSTIQLDQLDFIMPLSHLFHRTQHAELSLAGLQANDFAARHIHLHLHWQKNTLLRLKMIVQSLYEGQLQLKLLGKWSKLDDVLPIWEWQAQLHHVDLTPLLQALAPDHPYRLSGLLDGQSLGVTKGLNQRQFIEHLEGMNQFRINNGALIGIDFNYLLHFTNAFINKLPMNHTILNVNRTLFNQFDGTAVFKKGMVLINRLQLNAGQFRVTGEGQIALLDTVQPENMKLQLQIIPNPSMSDAWIIPIEVAGPLNHPVVELDAMTLGQLMLKKSLNHLVHNFMLAHRA